MLAFGKPGISWATVPTPVKARLLPLALCLALSVPAMAENIPDFKLPGLNPRDSVDMTKLHGQVVVIDFWASWCAPCKRTLPALTIMKTEFPQTAFVAISVDEDLAKARRFLVMGSPHGLLTAHDAGGKLADKLNVAGMPTLILADRKGRIRYRHDGYTERDLDKIKIELQVLEREK